MEIIIQWLKNLKMYLQIFILNIDQMMTLKWYFQMVGQIFGGMFFNALGPGYTAGNDYWTQF